MAFKKTKLTKARRNVVDEIRRLYSLRHALNISAVKERQPDLILEAYRAKPFWGWKGALESACLDYSKINVRLPKTIACRICGAKRKTLAKHISSAHGMSSATYREMYRGAQLTSDEDRARLFGRSGSDRTKDARRIIPHWEPVWTPEYVLDRLAELHRTGHPMNPAAIEKGEYSLYLRTRRYFGKWDTALKAIDVDPGKARLQAAKRKWTRDSVIAALCRRSLTKQPLNWRALEKDDKSLAKAARQLFVSYDKALTLAGLDPKAIRKLPVPEMKYRTEEHVISAILRRRLLKDQPLNVQAMIKGEDRDVALHNKARRMFGAWKAAIEAAGLDYESVKSRAQPYKTGSMVVDEIKRRRKEGLPLRTAGLRNGPDKDSKLYFQGLHFFNTWEAAVEAAGISYRSLFPAKGKYPTPEDVLAEIKRRRKAGLPLYSMAMHRGPHANLALIMKARKIFSSWRQAIEAAGLDYGKVMRPDRKYPDSEAVLAEIKRRHKAGLPLNAKAMCSGSHTDPALYMKASRSFGSWRQAIEAAGLDYGKVMRSNRKYPGPEAVLAEIKRRHKAGLPLNSKAMCSGSHTDHALFKKASKSFGSWRQAIEAAGLDYGKVMRPNRKYLSADDMIAEIKRRHAAGLGVNAGALTQREHPDMTLYQRGREAFGSWEKAIRAAGLDYDKVTTCAPKHKNNRLKGSIGPHK